MNNLFFVFFLADETNSRLYMNNPVNEKFKIIYFYEQPLVAPQLSHLRHVPFLNMVA